MPISVGPRKGTPVSLAAADLADEALRLADADPRRALETAKAATRLSHAEADLSAAAVAARATGLALFHLEDVEAAETKLREAVTLARRAHSSTLCAEVRMTLAYVLNWRGKSNAALRAIDAAVRDLAGVRRARAQAQRGTIRHQLGRFDRALPDYQAALRVLRPARDLRWTAHVLMNRGNGRAHRGEFEAAATDLREAQDLYRQLDMSLMVGHADHNLGYLEVLRGDLPAALWYFDRAEARFRELDSQLAPLLRDRAELLLSAQLIVEARDAAERTVQACISEGRRAILPEARLLLARVLQLQGNLSDALAQARAAARELDRQGQAELAALARLIVIILRLVSKGRDPATSQLPALIAASGGLWPQVPLEARIRAAESGLQRRNPAYAHELLAQASRGRHSGAATIRARAWYAQALRRRAEGNTRGAQSAARTGLRILDEYAAALGATDLRAHVAAHRNELALTGLRIAVEQGSPWQALRWAEHGRASHLHHAPGRPPTDSRLAEALAELRIVVREIAELRAGRRSSASLEHRQRALERRIRDENRLRRSSAETSLTLPPVADLAGALADAAVVEYVALDGMLHAVSVVGGRARMHSVAPLGEVLALAERLPFALHRLARRSTRPASKSAALELLTATARQLDSLLLRRIPDLSDRPLLIVPTQTLQWLPWSLLGSCAGRPITVAPSATLWHAVTTRAAMAGEVVVAAGPGLAGARAEAAAVAAIHGVAPLVDAAATTEAVASRLTGASIAHLATHGRVRADNPLFGSLAFTDGPLMIYDLERLERTPHTVVVAACDAGRPVVPIGDELLGLTATLLTHGTSQLVASVVPILDIETKPLMTALHRSLVRGEPVAGALAAAQQKIAATGPAGIATAAGFLCFGAGFRAPVLHCDAPISAS